MIRDGISVGVMREAGRRAGALVRSAVERAGRPTVQRTRVTHQAGELEIRPLRASDGDAWYAARRNNARRMDPWWDQAAGEADFYEHFFTWQRLQHRHLGEALAISTGHGVVGELNVYRTDPDRVELGLWCAPNGVSGRCLLGGLSSVIDELVGLDGIQRIDAPVTVGNPYPVGLLERGGFAHEGVLRGWRSLHGEMRDMHMYGMTASDWVTRRSTNFALQPWRQFPSCLPPLP